MINFNIYLLEDVESLLLEDLKRIGYSPITGELNHQNLLKNGIQLIIMGTDAHNKQTALSFKNELNIDILLIETNPYKRLNSLDITAIDPIGLIATPSCFDEVRISIKNIHCLIEYKNLQNEQSLWFRGILHTTKDGVIAIDHHGSIKFMNPIAQHIVGVEATTAIGMFSQRVIQLKSETKGILDIEDKGEENRNFEGEIYNRVTKRNIHISGSITSIRNIQGEFRGKVLTLKDVGEIKDLFSRISYQSSHDPLTGILNRKSFINYADELITLAKYEGSHHGLLVISLDKFRVINDTCGHIAGDELLRKIAYIIKEIDTNNRYIKGRIGGDEFGILLKESSISDIKHFTSSVKRRISKQDFIWGEKEFPIMCSYGIVSINNSIKDHYSLFAAVDDACAISKKKGGGKVEIYDNIGDEYNKRRGQMLWIHRLKDAITKDQFILYYQDIQSVKASNTKKIELLVRLKDDNGEILSPNDFIPSAEEYGLMPEIDKIVIEKAAIFCKELLDSKKYTYNYILCVNISGTSLLDRSLPVYIQNIFQKYKVPPTLFCFEITETATIQNMEIAQNFIRSLRRIGCTFSLDDFGSGFSNFTYLKDMEVENLKIDGSFIKDIENEPIHRAMVESINNIGHIMKMKTVAEFVTNENTREILLDIGVDYIQGYAISKPTPIQNLLL
ncbi:EAL domain-containing protein [Thiospirochaeta perfilievii]|uniref:EAL domain-containing protein n=1 Tax=Thiospirochaeta perfilievii TaxID=252967 RepID=A0A5C1QBL9_9SPIO|nr:EAL domain-containing protein [Thiospirochaeta perfilievii]QEN05463.1 EAL domain-containing protein [Thiospirochaeta perfilievii]